MVLIYIDHSEKEIKKSSHEAISYGAAIAKQLGCSAEALLLGTVNDDIAALGKLGASKVHQLNNESLNNFDAKVHASLIATAASNLNAEVIVFAHTYAERIPSVDTKISKIDPYDTSKKDEMSLAVQLYYKYILDLDFMKWAQEKWFDDITEKWQHIKLINLHCFPLSLSLLE